MYTNLEKGPFIIVGVFCHRYYNTWIGNGFRGPNIHCSYDVGTLETIPVIRAREK